MNETNIINALKAYDGTQPSLEKTVEVLALELGPEWTSLIFQQLGGLPVDLKEKLDHAFNYYASLTAWQEAQTYLTQEEPLDVQMMDERMPILKHWLDFFGQPGQDLYQQLEHRVRQLSPLSDAVLPDDEEGEADSGVNTTVSKNTETNSEPENHKIELSVSQEDVIPSATQVEPEHQQTDEISDFVQVEQEPTKQEEIDSDDLKEDDDYSEMPQDDDTPEGFAVHKAEREIVLLEDLQSWLAARCVQLGDIEVFAYPYYGMVVDLMRQTSKDIQTVLELENQDLVLQYYPDGLEDLRRKKQAIDSDIQIAVENCESDTTALIDKGMDMNKVKKMLGDLDTSTDVEFAGPAPDGFELMDDDQPIDEEAVKQQYQKLEEQSKENTDTNILSSEEKNTSQNEQNSVQRKLSFSLKPKKG